MGQGRSLRHYDKERVWSPTAPVKCLLNCSMTATQWGTFSSAVHTPRLPTDEFGFLSYTKIQSCATSRCRLDMIMHTLRQGGSVASSLRWANCLYVIKCMDPRVLLPQIVVGRRVPVLLAMRSACSGQSPRDQVQFMLLIIVYGLTIVRVTLFGMVRTGLGRRRRVEGSSGTQQFLYFKAHLG